MSTNTSDQHTLWGLIKDIKFGMLTHRHSDGMLHSHPLTTHNQSADEGSRLYFFVSRNSEIARRLLQDSKVSVSYADPGKDSYPSLSSQGAIVNDGAKKAALGSPMAKAWFQGPTDPDLALRELSIRHAEFWDVKESRMVQLAKMAKAALTGEPPKSLGEHKELTLS